MNFKSGEKLVFLRSDRKISGTRAWSSRVLLFFLVLLSLPQWTGIAFAVGNLLGLAGLYWILMRVLSVPDDADEKVSQFDSAANS